MKPVAIIGGGITGLAAAWELQRRGIEYILLEAAGRLGGKLITERVDGFVIEGAADSFLVQKPWAWQLCWEIGLGDRLIGTNDDRRQVYVLRGGRLRPLPRGLRLLVPTDAGALLESDLLSEAGKRRMLAESEVPPRTDTGDESLADFVRRRFGQEALDALGEPLLAGIYTGDPETLSMAATFPNYLALEQRYGSLIKGTLETPPLAPPAGPPPTMFVSLKNGMQEMVEGLAAVLTGKVCLNSPVESIGEDGALRLSGGEILETAGVILTAPARTAARLVRQLSPTLAGELGQVRVVGSAVVTLAYRESDLPGPLDGFGFVVAAGEQARLLASTWSSAKLPGRAPAGCALLRVFVGGHRHPSDALLSGPELVGLARTELERIMSIRAEPLLTRVFRWPEANHQYEVGHLERVAAWQRMCPDWLRLAGAPYGGVGIPDCVRQGRQAATFFISEPFSK